MVPSLPSLPFIIGPPGSPALLVLVLFILYCLSLSLSLSGILEKQGRYRIYTSLATQSQSPRSTPSGLSRSQAWSTPRETLASPAVSNALSSNQSLSVQADRMLVYSGEGEGVFLPCRSIRLDYSVHISIAIRSTE